MGASRHLVAGAMMILALAFASGCAVEVTVTGPETASPGSPVQMTLGFQNRNFCPVGEVVGVFFPFISIDELEVEGEGELADLVLALFTAVCRQTDIDLPDIDCRIVEGQLECDPPSGGLSTPGGEGVTVSGPGGSILACQRREDGGLRCRLPLATTLPSVVAAPLQTISCSPPSPSLCTGSLASGGSVSHVFDLHAPLPLGEYFSIGLAFSTTDLGVCIDGDNAGEPCDDDLDCANATLGCGTGICVDDETAEVGSGCNDTGDCDAGETCIDCAGLSGDPLGFIGCQVTQVVPGSVLPAPAASPLGLLAAVLSALAVAFFGLRRARDLGIVARRR